MVDSAWAQGGLHRQRPSGPLPRLDKHSQPRGWGSFLRRQRTGYPRDNGCFFYLPTSRIQPFRLYMRVLVHACACMHTHTWRLVHQTVESDHGASVRRLPDY